MVYHAPFLCSAQLSRLVPENTRSYPPIYSSHSIQISYHVHKCKALKAGLHIRRKKLRLPDAFVRNANNAVVRGGGLRSPTYQLNLSRCWALKHGKHPAYPTSVSYNRCLR